MAKSTGLAQNFYAHGYDLSGDVGSISNASSPRNVFEVTGLSASAVERLLGLSDSNIAYDLFFNDAALQEHAGLAGRATTDVNVLWALGTTVGDPAAFCTGKQLNYDWTRGADGSLTGSVETQGNATTAGAEALWWGKMLSAGKITHGSASSSSSYDDAAQTTAGARLQLQVFDINSGTPTVVVEDSPNDSSWSTLKAFAAVANGNEPTAEQVTITGTVERYVRLTTTGTFSNLDFAVAYARGTAQDDVDLS